MRKNRKTGRNQISIAVTPKSLQAASEVFQIVLAAEEGDRVQRKISSTFTMNSRTTPTKSEAIIQLTAAPATIR